MPLPGQDPAPPSGSAPRRWRDRLALPRPCACCGTWARRGLCADCEARFIGTQPRRCPRCALPSPGGQVCGACLRQPPPFGHCIAVADYGFPFDRLIARLKFESQPEQARLLARLLHQAVQHAAAPPVQAVLPVPLSETRLAERGYNQAWELARHVAARQGLPAAASWLLRLRDTPHQVGLSRSARQRNLHDAMWVTPAAARALAGCRVALVDDVMTTGVTAAAATQALQAAGIAEVQVWVIARTPAPTD